MQILLFIILKAYWFQLPQPKQKLELKSNLIVVLYTLFFVTKLKHS